MEIRCQTQQTLGRFGPETLANSVTVVRFYVIACDGPVLCHLKPQCQKLT